MLVAGRVGDAPATPRAPTLIFDGSCRFCRRWVDRIKRWDRDNIIRVVPLQDPEASALSGQNIDRLRQAAHFVRPDGAVFAGAAAAWELCKFLPAGWIVRLPFRVPGALPVAERVYAWVVRRWGPVR